MQTVAPDRVEFSLHACERWVERARPSISTRQAAKELRTLLQLGQIEIRSWTIAHPTGELTLVVGQFQFPLVRQTDGRLLAVTCFSTKRKGSTHATSGQRRVRRQKPYRRPHHVDWLADSNDS